MAQQIENVDLSGLFKLDVLIHLDIASHSFYEVGLKKFLGFSSNRELVFVYIDSQGERLDHVHDWDFVDNPVYCMCFEPTGTWMLIVSEEKLLLVPFLPLFDSKNNYDLKWSLNSVTVLPLGTSIANPTSVVWWLTKDSENILVLASKSGSLVFYSFESQSIVGETKVPGEVNDLQICYDDSLDLLTLLISSSNVQQWKLVLEHRSVGYNWLHQTNVQSNNKREGFMNYIKQLSKDKITVLMQGGAKDDSKAMVEYVLKPTEYLPVFRKGSNNWALTAQYVNGRHFLTAFEVHEGTIILESPEEDAPSRTLRPHVKKDGQYIQGLWSQRLIYLLRKNELEIHSANFSVIQGDGLHGVKREFSELWSAELIGDAICAYLMSTKEPPGLAGGWREPTFLCDLQLPRFNLESCLVITTKGAYVLNTVCEPCEWLVGMVTRAGAGAERAAAGLGAPVPALLRAAADLLLARGKLPPAHYLYSLSQSPTDGWVARLGVFGRLQELSMFKMTGNVGSLSNAAITIKLLATLLKIATNREEEFDWDSKYTSLSTVELSELAAVSAALGLWDVLPIFTIHRGQPALMLSAIRSIKELCRGAVHCLINHKCLVPLLLEDNAQWLFHFITGNCGKFDSAILKGLCLWLNPLQDQLRPVMRDLKQGMTTIYVTRMLNLITTFIHVASEIESRHSCPEIHTNITQIAETWKNQFVPRRALSCGLAHWAVVDDGNAKIMMTDTVVNNELIGRVIDVACGRHHTLVLTENGIYASGDNSYGQLGVGDSWAGAVGDAASPAGALLHVAHCWTAPLSTIAAGHYHSAAVDVGGRLYTWGWGVHGQLGLGNIDDQCSPQLVTKLQGRKVLNVGCGACHTVVLMRNGEVWAFGAGVFGQLGTGGRDKATVPVKVPLPEPAELIAVGYFHNLALTSKGQVVSWGASPQQVRATHARRSASPPPPAPPADPHLRPLAVSLDGVHARVVQLAAGWHHSCILDAAGNIYTWGLNFDGQLGSGDRKQIQTPTEVKFRDEARQPDSNKNSAKTPDRDNDSLITTKALVACGGDFTVFIDNDGRIYTTGNMHLPIPSEREKGNRVIMMKTTKRVIKIPASRGNNKFIFQPIDRIDIMFPFDIEGFDRKPIEPSLNPLNTLEDFDSQTWADDIILILKPWINAENLSANLNMAAKLAYHNKSYADCLKLLLDNLKEEPRVEKLYLTHSLFGVSGKINLIKYCPTKQDELKIKISNTMSKRIKEISLTILNEDSYPAMSPDFLNSLPCCCAERKYLPNDASRSAVNIPGRDFSLLAAHIIDTCIARFPFDPQLWEKCFRLSREFFVENKCQIQDLEQVLRKYMESNATTMASAILYSDDCSQYQEILTPKFYLNMCSRVLDTWG